MALTVLWTRQAEQRLMNLGMTEASAIDAEVQRFARTLVGAVTRLTPNNQFLLQAGSVRAVVQVQRNYAYENDDGEKVVEDVVWVLTVRRARP